MGAQPQPNSMNPEIERELARRLDVAKHENKPAEVQIAGNRYRLVPVDDTQTTDEPNAAYDPQQMREAIHAAAGTMKGVNREELPADLRAERGQGRLTVEDVQAAKGNLRKHFGSVTPHHRPEDFAALREEFERGVAEDARTRGHQ